MPENPLPWLILAGIVLASLHYKGYLKLPNRAANATRPPVGDELVKLGSHALGIAWGKAIKIEAKLLVASSVSREAGEALMKRFTDPFSGAGPKDPDPRTNNVPPT